SKLSMAEIGRRMLPAAILLKIADLQVSLNKNDNSRSRRMELLTGNEPQHKPLMPDILPGAMLAKEHQCNYKLHTLKGKLNAMSEQYDHLRKCLKGIETVLADRTKNSNDYPFWKWQQDRVLTRLMSCSLLRQDELRLKIKILEAESLYYK
ncbi:MAG TPA: hypothetical protein VK484_14595, partial [Ferruginibacter sp.]|nr:hypothetical protein [Ferruginibacter sp.]